MATLSIENRQRIWRGLMRYWSNLRESLGLSKSDLWAAVVATDQWIDDNATSYNTELPEAARTALTVDQKTLLFCCVAAMRAGGGLANLLRRVLGVEVD